MKTTTKKPIKSNVDISKTRKSKPPRTLEDAENENIALAMKLAKKQLEEGTASSQVITHYLKLGSTKERDESRLRNATIDLTEAKRSSLKSSETAKELTEKAIKALAVYSGEGEPDDYD